MFTSYFKIAARHIARNRSYVLINVVGLGIAIACTMIAFVNWKAGNYADSFHENYDRLFRVIAVTPSTTAPTANLSSPLAPTAAADIAGIEAGIRFDRRTAIISLDDKIYEERVATVDPNFLEVFTFPLIEGKKSALEDPNQLLISQRMAEKYFPETSALGQLLTVNPNQAGGRKMVVGGVFENVKSQNSSLVFDFLTNIDYVETGMVSDTLAKWDNRVDATFVLLTNPNESEVIAEQMNRYIPVQNDAMPGDKRSSYLLQPMNDVYMGGLDVNNNWINKAISPAFYWGPWVMALMILLTACLNFTNTTISFSNKRLKEMGIRKVMGSNRIQ
ncbi:MAG: ABC transporter permease, partial [Bacteroidota bacterium]